MLIKDLIAEAAARQDEQPGEQLKTFLTMFGTLLLIYVLGTSTGLIAFFCMLFLCVELWMILEEKKDDTKKDIE
jgi:hypothetical protein